MRTHCHMIVTLSVFSEPSLAVLLKQKLLNMCVYLFTSEV